MVQELFGHSSVQLTLDTYSHLLPDLQLKERVAARIDAILAGENAGQNSGQNQENLVSREGIEPVGEAEGRSRLPEFFVAKPPRTK